MTVMVMIMIYWWWHSATPPHTCLAFPEPWWGRLEAVEPWPHRQGGQDLFGGHTKPLSGPDLRWPDVWRPEPHCRKVLLPNCSYLECFTLCVTFMWPYMWPMLQVGEGGAGDSVSVQQSPVFVSADCRERNSFVPASDGWWVCVDV